VGVPSDAFVPLEAALLEAQTWAPIRATELESSLHAALATALPEVMLEPVGLRPLRDVTQLGPGEGEGT
jgi:hypothetical protein